MSAESANQLHPTTTHLNLPTRRHPAPSRESTRRPSSSRRSACCECHQHPRAPDRPNQSAPWPRDSKVGTPEIVQPLSSNVERHTCSRALLSATCLSPCQNTERQTSSRPTA